MSIINFKKNATNQAYLAVSVLGNIYKLNIKYGKISSVELNMKNTEIDLILPVIYKNKDNTDLINLSIEKLYNKIAEIEIEYSMEIARHILKFAPNDYSFKRLNNDYCKCYKKQIIINPDIVKFNREIINTTIIQAFCKIKYKTNTNLYKHTLNSAMNEYEILKEKKYSRKVS